MNLRKSQKITLSVLTAAVVMGTYPNDGFAQSSQNCGPGQQSQNCSSNTGGSVGAGSAHPAMIMPFNSAPLARSSGSTEETSSAMTSTDVARGGFGGESMGHAGGGE